MNDKQARTGGRLGPYHLGKQYRDLDLPGVRVYEAHHVDTGASALVLVPERSGDWALRRPWTAKLTAESSPAFLAMQIDRPPPAESSGMHGLTLGVIQLAGVLASTEERTDTVEHLTRPPGSRRLESGERSRAARPGVWAGALVAGVLIFAAGVLWARPPKNSEAPRSANGAVAPTPESVAFIDQSEVPPSVAYPMPDVAFPEQQKPPCRPETDVEIRGGCWVPLEYKPPCPKSTAEHEGKCYMPVHKKNPVPRSVQP